MTHNLRRLLYLIAALVFSACSPVANPTSTPAPFATTEANAEVTIEATAEVTPLEMPQVANTSTDVLNELVEYGWFEMEIFVEPGDIPYVYLWVYDTTLADFRVNASINGETTGKISYSIILSNPYKVSSDIQGENLLFEGSGMDMVLKEFVGSCDIFETFIACQAYSWKFADN